MKKLLLALFLVLAFGVSTVFANPTANVTFEWDANTEADLVGYKLYQSPISVSTLDDDNDGIITLEELLTGSGVVVANILAGAETITIQVQDGVWYYVLTAYDAGNESFPSNEVTATIDTSAPSAPGGLNITIIIKIGQ